MQKHDEKKEKFNMDVPSYFKDFLSEIRLTPNQLNDLKTGHKTLRKRLENDTELADLIVSTFLQGSYKRSTAVRPKGGKRSDVDVIVVTNLDPDQYTPEKALKLFEPFLEEHYKGKYRPQGRSFGICLTYVDLDIVITSAPSESEENIIEKSEPLSNLSIENIFQELSNSKVKFAFLETFAKKQDDSEWKLEPLYIPDREAKEWKPTHPLEQIRWTVEKNNKTNGHYINVVKSLKWWKKYKYPDAGHPKSYPFEHFIGDCCPDGIESVAEGITSTLEKIVSDYEDKPFCPDRGVTNHDVFGRITDKDYNDFYSQVSEAAVIAREALDSDDLSESVEKWKQLFGTKFPDTPNNNNNNNNNNNSGFSKRTEKTSNVPGGSFA